MFRNLRLARRPAADLGETVLHKVTWRFLPLVGLCYVVLYLDRLNVGVAALTMNRELSISASAYGFAAGVYFWSYTACEPPSNFVLSRIGARVWISRIMVTWGLVTMATALVQGEVSLAVMRFLLGIAEAGFSPGMLYFVSRWFPAARRGAAMSWVVGFICVSGLTTPISTYLLRLDGLAGLSGWRWLFLLTGLPAVVLGFVCFRVFREKPAEATFLTEPERGWLERTLAAEDERTAGGAKHAFRRGLAHPRVLVLILVFCCVTFSLNGYQLWMPQIFQQFGLSTIQIGWVATLPSLVAIGPMLWWNRHSDRTGERALHFVAPAALAAAGFVFAAAFLSQPVIAMVGFCVAGTGLYTAMAVFITMPGGFLTGAALAAGFGVINGVGNLGGYFGPQVTGLIKEATGSFVLAVGVFGLAMALAAAIVLSLRLVTGRAAAPAKAKVR